ncbi:MAG TPA: bacteriohemerythrin [Terracidiphilus sp.]|nr:bacteriohemerythrin [Terracidiphilus sp.]
MALMIWSDKLSVGVQSIDAQHSVLVEALNELHGAMMKGQARSLTGPLLRNLVAYTRDHFAAEEAMMAAAKYPGLTEHHLRHRDLSQQVEGYIARFEQGEITLSLHLLNFLRDWLTNHILKEDRAYGPWLNEHGIR